MDSFPRKEERDPSRQGLGCPGGPASEVLLGQRAVESISYADSLKEQVDEMDESLENKVFSKLESTLEAKVKQIEALQLTHKHNS